MGVGAVFEGVEWVWAVWAVGLAVLARAAVSAARGFRLPSAAAVARDETGVSYSLSYVLVVPIYLFFLCMVFNASLILLAKIGTLYAAHAGARSAAVWQSARPASLRRERIEQAVFTAVAPFVSASERDLAAALTRRRPPEKADIQAGEFVWAYTVYSAGARNQNGILRRPYRRQDATARYLTTKYLNAATRTTFDVGGEPDRPGGPATVTVTYRSPIYFPLVNRFLDPDGRWPYELPVRSAATIPNETPATADRTLGIDYRSR